MTLGGRAQVRYRTQRLMPLGSDTVLKLISTPLRQGLRWMAGSSPATAGEALCLVQRKDTFHRLEFQDRLRVHDDVGEVAVVQVCVVIQDREGDLALER